MKTTNIVLSVFGILFIILSFISMAFSERYLISLVLFFIGMICFCTVAMLYEHTYFDRSIKTKIVNRSIGILDN